MADKNNHLSDRDLLMAADGELPASSVAEVSAHLDACRSCRERLSSIENTIAEYVGELSRDLPSAAGPRSLLLARLAEQERASASTWWQRRAMRLAVPAAAVFFSVAVMVTVFEVRVDANGPKPRAGLTPGEIRPITLDEVCRNGRAEVIVRNIPEETRQRVFSEYGISGHSGSFEVDYLITPDLGGAPSIRNLWPQPYATRWNARVKDQLEQRLHELVCQGQLDLPTAQHDLASDWISAYKKYFHTNKPPAEQ